MKNILIPLLLLLACCTQLQSQTIAFETQYKEDYVGYSALLSVNNEIIAIVYGKDCKDFFLTTDNGTIERKEGDCKWNYIPSKATGQHYHSKSKIFFNQIINGDTIIFHEKRLYIKPFRFLPVLASKFYPEKDKVLFATKEELRNVTLVMDALNTGYNMFTQVANFEFQIIRNNELFFSEKIKILKREDHEIYQKQFEELETGDIVKFINIQYKYPNSVNPTHILDTYDIIIKIK